MNIQQEPRLSVDPRLESLQYERVQQLIERSVADGSLSRSQDDDILAAITTTPRPTAALCGLFRILQERVWQGEVTLGD